MASKIFCNKTYDSYHSCEGCNEIISEEQVYCDRHRCNKQNCINEKSKFSKYCNVHTCTFGLCKNETIHNTYYCEEHINNL